MKNKSISAPSNEEAVTVVVYCNDIAPFPKDEVIWGGGGYYDRRGVLESSTACLIGRL